MLKLDSVSAGYGDLKILHSLDLVVNENEIVALIGPNGAGKSTVLKSIFSIAHVTSGKIIFKGRDITHDKTHELIQKGISYVQQGKINFGNLTIKENLDIGESFISDKTTIKKQLNIVYSIFPVLKQRRKSLAYGLSGGQQQMLAIGRALMQQPTLLLLDEPSLGLSPKLQSEVFSIIKKLKSQGLSILVVEQNAKKAIEIADRTCVLEDGKIVLEGSKGITKHEKIQNIYLGGR